MTYSFRAALLTALLASAPAALTAQQRPAAPATVPAAPPAAGQQPSPQVQAWFTELRDIDQRLQGIQMKALQDPSLDSVRQSLGAQIEAAVVRADTSLSGLPERVTALQAKLQQAQQAGDQATFQQLVAQGQALEERFLRAREKALAQPELAARAERFQNDLEKRMVALDPEVPKLLARGKDLQAKLQGALGSNGAPR